MTVDDQGRPVHADRDWFEFDITACERIELKALREWKASAMQVEREWDPNHIASLLGGQPGESQRIVIMREVPKLVARNRELEQGLVVIQALMKLV